VERFGLLADMPIFELLTEPIHPLAQRWQKGRLRGA
jgi:hypothetical protein